MKNRRKITTEYRTLIGSCPARGDWYRRLQAPALSDACAANDERQRTGAR